MRKSSDILAHELRWANFVAPTGTNWQHKKGGVYRVIGHHFSTAREEVEVVYVRMSGPNFDQRVDPLIPYARPLSEWTRDRFVEA